VIAKLRYIIIKHYYQISYILIAKAIFQIIIKGDEVIKKLHSLLTKSTEKTCIKMAIEYQQCILNCD
jgi:hypothetical protein